ncbi:MAG: hypothetical protein WBG36_07880 [Ornithinimicrobium sp.]
MKSGNGQRWSFVIPGMRRSVEQTSGHRPAVPNGPARRVAVALVLALATFTAGCAGDPGRADTGDTSEPSATPGDDQAEETQLPGAAMPEDLATATSTLNVPVRPNAVLTGQGLVLQVDDDPPVLCLAPYVELYPPQCSGPLLLGLDWEEMPNYSMAQDVRWGEARVFGTFDGATFTLTQPPSPPSLPVEPDGGLGSDPLTTICDNPFATGGSGLDPLSAEAEDAHAAAVAIVEDNPDYATSFISDESSVLNVLLVADADVAPVQEALREVWPGGLCVETANVPSRDAVYRAMDTLNRADLPDVFSWTASPEGGLEVEVIRADEDMIIRIYSVLATVLDQDDIHITSALTPLDPQPQR